MTYRPDISKWGVETVLQALWGTLLFPLRRLIARFAVAE